ncbi:hypothetical protein V6N12_074937 [Hibiscus sabdariffa]|uniref:O-fucosyltransferase family protein n=1 Tax=Hibiscus sabdariffa TaxID=183260 RepID=A0ABR2AXB8_9ROSI
MDQFRMYQNIIDVAVVACILNLTHVVRKLEQKSLWKDTNNFSEIFGVDWLISYLSKDVKIIKKLPKGEMRSWTPYNVRVPRKCSASEVPLTLKEAGLMLSALGYGSNAHIYVASNEVCEREKTLRVQREFEVQVWRSFGLYWKGLKDNSMLHRVGSEHVYSKVWIVVSMATFNDGLRLLSYGLRSLKLIDVKEGMTTMGIAMG